MRILNCKLDDCSGAVYIGRPSVFGNPFVIGKDGTRDEVIAKYRRWFWARLRDEEFARQALSLKGRDLCCWCAPAPCHGDVIKRWFEAGWPLPAELT